MKKAVWIGLAAIAIGIQGYGAPLNVRDFGAKGDGVTDDTAAIAKALVEVKAKNAPLRVRAGWVGDGPVTEVFFPKGTYNISDTLGAERDIVLRGEEGSVIRQTITNKDSIFCNGAFRCRVENLSFIGGRMALRFSTHNNDTANITVRGCEFRDLTGAAVECLSFSHKVDGKTRALVPYTVKDGLAIVNPKYDGPRGGYPNSTLFTIENCTFDNCFRAAHFGGDGSVVRNCRVVSALNGDGGVFVVGGRAHLYGLDITLRRGNNSRLCAFECSGGATDIEQSVVRTDDGRGACTVRSSMVSRYVPSYLAFNDMTVESGKNDEAAPIVLEKGTVPTMISISGIKEKGTRHADPVYSIGGLTEEVKAAARYFKGIPVERTYTRVDSEKARWRPEAPKVPAKLNGPVLNATDFGLDMNPNTDDTEALRKVFAAASGKRATVMLPATWVNLSDTVEVPDGIAIVGEGIAGIRMADDTKPMLRARNFTDITFRNIHFHLAKNAVVAQAKERGLWSRLAGNKPCLQFYDCFFSDLKAYSVGAVTGELTHNGADDMDVIIDGGVAFTMKLYCGNGNFWWDREWLEVLNEDKEGKNLTSVACVNYGRMVVRDMLGVPCVFCAIQKRLDDDKSAPRTVGDYRWVDNYGDFYSFFTRFGGEWGGVTPVYTYGKSLVHIEGGFHWFENSLTRRYPVVADSPSASVSMFCTGFSPNLGGNPIELVWRDKNGEFKRLPKQDFSCYFPINK